MTVRETSDSSLVAESSFWLDENWTTGICDSILVGSYPTDYGQGGCFGPHVVRTGHHVAFVSLLYSGVGYAVRVQQLR
jgi:hypothetical protein